MSLIDRPVDDEPTSSGGWYPSTRPTPVRGMIVVAPSGIAAASTSQPRTITVDRNGPVWGYGNQHKVYRYPRWLRLTALLATAFIVAGAVIGYAFPGKITGVILPIGVILWVVVVYGGRKNPTQRPSGVGSAG